MDDLVRNLRAVALTDKFSILAGAAANEIERLCTIEKAASALKFGGYPAHGSGFVIIVTDGNVDDLAAALQLSN